MSGRKAPHNEVIPLSLFEYDAKTKTFFGYHSNLSQRHGHHFNTLITIHNEKTHGEVTFECDQVVEAAKPLWWKMMRFKSLSKDHPELRLTVINQ
jgi:hypothetical protein